MAEDSLLELSRQLRISQDKYVYTMLAAAGAAIALALNRTANDRLTVQHIPWALAVISWGGSFLFGSLYPQYVSSTLIANIELLRVSRGIHPEVGKHPQLIEAASDGIRSALKENSERASLYFRWQFRFFIAGSISYIVWHVLKMCRLG